MAHSFKKHPIGSHYTTKSDRPWKLQAHRNERRTVRRLLRSDPFIELLPYEKQFGDAEDFGKGSKVYLPNWVMLWPGDPYCKWVLREQRK